MAAAGADADDTNSAISQVRHVSWGAGRTFRRKHVVLLSSAEASKTVCSCLRAGRRMNPRLSWPYTLPEVGFDGDAVCQTVSYVVALLPHTLVPSTGITDRLHNLQISGFSFNIGHVLRRGRRDTLQVEKGRASSVETHQQRPPHSGGRWVRAGDGDERGGGQSYTFAPRCGVLLVHYSGGFRNQPRCSREMRRPAKVSRRRWSVSASGAITSLPRTSDLLCRLIYKRVHWVLGARRHEFA